MQVLYQYPALSQGAGSSKIASVFSQFLRHNCDDRTGNDNTELGMHLMLENKKHYENSIFYISCNFKRCVHQVSFFEKLCKPFFT